MSDTPILSVNTALTVPANYRCYVAIDTSEFKSHVAMALSLLHKNFIINYAAIFDAIAEELGTIVKADFFISNAIEEPNENLMKFKRYVRAVGGETHFSTIIRQGRFENGTYIKDSVRILNTAKVDMAAAIANAAASKRYDCIVVFSNNIIYEHVIRKYVNSQGVASAILYVKDGTKKTVSRDLLDAYIYHIVATKNIITIYNNGNPPNDQTNNDDDDYDNYDDDYDDLDDIYTDNMEEGVDVDDDILD